MPDDLINMRLHEVELTHYDRRADVLASIAASDEVSAETSEKLMAEALAIYGRARAFAPRPGSVNVRGAVIEILRKMGGQP